MSVRYLKIRLLSQGGLGMQKSITVPLIPLLLLSGALGIGVTSTTVASIGEQLIAGANQLKNAVGPLQEGKNQLKERVITGLETIVNKQVALKITDIQNKRQQIADFKKKIEQQKSLAESAGKGALIQDLLEGLTEADAALAMLYNPSPPSGILTEFANASNATIRKTNELVAKLDGYITELTNKINHKKFCWGPGFKCTLPERLQRIGTAVKKLSKKKKK